MRVLICGNCVWHDSKPIFDTMYAYKEKVKKGKLTFISGMAPGADYISYVLTHALDVPCDEYPWNDEGRKKAKLVALINGMPFDESAPRNQWMLDSGVDVCHAYAEDLPGGWSGTRDMVNRCLEAGVPCFWHDGTTTYKIHSDHRKTHKMVYTEVGLEASLLVEG